MHAILVDLITMTNDIYVKTRAETYYNTSYVPQYKAYYNTSYVPQYKAYYNTSFVPQYKAYYNTSFVPQYKATYSQRYMSDCTYYVRVIKNNHGHVIN